MLLLHVLKGSARAKGTGGRPSPAETNQTFSVASSLTQGSSTPGVHLEHFKHNSTLPIG